METLIFSILSVVAVTNVILGVVIFSRGLRVFSNILFGLIAFTTAVWSMAIVGFYSPQFSGTLNWILWTHTAAILIPFFFLAFSVNFPQKLGHRKDMVTISTIITFFLILFVFFSNYIIGGTEGNMYQIGPAYPVYASFISIFFFAGFLFLWEQLKLSKDDDQKKQVEYVLAGSLIASTLAIVPDLILPYLKIFQFTWLGPIFTLIMVVSLFLAMLRYHLFNIKVILTEVVSILIVVALLLELFSAQSPAEIFLKSVVLVIVTVFSFLLIKGVYKEIAQREALAISNENQKNLIHIMNHQIKGYLGKARVIFAELMTDDYGSVPDMAKPLIKEGFDQSSKGVDYVESILKGASAASGVLAYDMKPMDLSEIVHNVLNREQILAGERGMTVIDNTRGGDYHMVGDPTQLEEALRNFVENAIKYNRPKGSVTVSLVRNNKEILFSVKDTGYGVADDVKDRLFTAGGRSKDSTKYNTDSSGFGLAFVKGVIEKHGGTVGYTPNVGEEGTTFFAKLPVTGAKA